MVQTRRVAAAVIVAAVAMASSAQATNSTSDRPATIQVWPKILVDASGRFTNGAPVNTLITLSNTNRNNETAAHCFYTNGNSHCADNPSRVCRSSADCVTTVGNGTNVAECDPGWNEMDFDIRLTKEQPIAWYADGGLQRGQFPIEGPFKCNSPFQSIDCTSDLQCFGAGCNGVDSSNLGSGIPPVPEDPFIGTLTCIEFENTDPPTLAFPETDLIGDATIITRNDLLTPASPVDVAKYNSIGSRVGNFCLDPNPLIVEHESEGQGRCYDPCAGTLILSHLFDGAIDPLASTAAQTVSTELTLVPCGNDFADQIPGRTTAQFLVFNEFEQRFSTSRTVDCLFDGTLSSIDTRNPSRSIFSAGVAGTISGQTRIRGVGPGATIPDAGFVDNGNTGSGLLGVARLLVLNPTNGSNSGATYNLHQQGSTAGTNIIRIP